MRSLALVFVLFAVAHAVPVDEQQAAVPKIPAHHDSRIINGVPAANNTEFPYQVGFDKYMGNFSYFCGGSLIGNKWILTSASCVSEANHILVYLNSIELGLGSSLEEGDLEVLARDKHIHPDFNRDNFQNDIAIIELRDPVTLTPSIQTIRLPNAEEHIGTGVQVTLSGWGDTDSKEVTDVLNSATFTTTTNERCQETQQHIFATNLCAVRQTGQGACYADLGGPLVATDANGQRYQVGVYSRVPDAGCDSDDPGIYIRPEHYLEWIRRITGLNF